MKTLIFVLSLCFATSALAAQPNLQCESYDVESDERIDGMELVRIPGGRYKMISENDGNLGILYPLQNGNWVDNPGEYSEGLRWELDFTASAFSKGKMTHDNIILDFQVGTKTYYCEIVK